MFDLRALVAVFVALSPVPHAASRFQSAAVPYRTGFASYASDDRDAVLGRIQGIHKVAPVLEIFLDVRKSEWVEREWRCALRERGIGFIDPCRSSRSRNLRRLRNSVCFISTTGPWPSGGEGSETCFVSMGEGI